MSSTHRRLPPKSTLASALCTASKKTSVASRLNFAAPFVKPSPSRCSMICEVGWENLSAHCPPRAGRHWTCLSAPVPGRCFAIPLSIGLRPSLRDRLPSLVREFLRYYDGVWLPMSVHHPLQLLTFMARTSLDCLLAGPGSPGFRASLPTCQGLRPCRAV